MRRCQNIRNPGEKLQNETLYGKKKITAVIFQIIMPSLYRYLMKRRYLEDGWD